MLACRRNDVRQAWQLPQGGIDAGEDADSAMLRELLEEIGTAAVDLIARLPEPIRYEWPQHLYNRGYRGQEQTYFLTRLRPDAVIDLANHHTPEFDLAEWITADEFLRRSTGFKASAYRQALHALDALAPGILRWEGNP